MRVRVLFRLWRIRGYFCWRRNVSGLLLLRHVHLKSPRFLLVLVLLIRIFVFCLSWLIFSSFRSFSSSFRCVPPPTFPLARPQVRSGEGGGGAVKEGRAHSARNENGGAVFAQHRVPSFLPSLPSFLPRAFFRGGQLARPPASSPIRPPTNCQRQGRASDVKSGVIFWLSPRTKRTNKSVAGFDWRMGAAEALGCLFCVAARCILPWCMFSHHVLFVVSRGFLLSSFFSSLFSLPVSFCFAFFISSKHTLLHIYEYMACCYT